MSSCGQGRGGEGEGEGPGGEPVAHPLPQYLQLLSVQ